MRIDTAIAWRGGALGLLLLLCLPAAGIGADEPPPRIDWLVGDLPVAMEEALLTRRPVMVTFTTSWCGWCRKLEATTFRDPDFVRTAGAFVTVQVDGDKDRGAVARYRVKGYPTTVLLDRRGTEIGRVVGYRQAADFQAELMRALRRREPWEETRTAAEANPSDPRAQYAWGDVLLAVGEYVQARGVLAGAQALAGEEGSSLADEAELDIALTYVYAYDFETALPLLEAYLEGGGDRVRRDEALFFAGLALVRTGRTEEGFARLDEAARETSSAYIQFEVERLRKQGEEIEGSE